VVKNLIFLIIPVILSNFSAHSQTITLATFLNNSDYKEENIEKKITLRIKQELENRGYRIVALCDREGFKKGLEDKGIWISAEIKEFYLGTTLFSFGPFRYRTGNAKTEINLQIIKNGKLLEEPVEVKEQEDKTNFILFSEEEIEKREEEKFDNSIKEKFLKEITEEIISKLLQKM